MLFKLIAIAQEFNAPFFGGNIKIYLAAFVSVFGKENPWNISGSSGKIRPDTA